jgi:signal transduction histidine kinase
MSDTQTDLVREPESSSAIVREAPRAEELGLTVTRIFKTPLAALRAAMESLARNLDASDARSTMVAGALAEVKRIARDVDALAAYAAPSPLVPLECSLEEVLQGVVARLAPREAARVTIARPAVAATLWIDGPLLSTALSHVVRLALESSGDDVLFEARVERDRATFAIICGGDLERLEALQAPRSHQDASLGLGFDLARRDVARMHGTFELAHRDGARLCVRVAIPRCAPPLPRRAA